MMLSQDKNILKEAFHKVSDEFTKLWISHGEPQRRESDLEVLNADQLLLQNEHLQEELKHEREAVEKKTKEEQLEKEKNCILLERLSELSTLLLVAEDGMARAQNRMDRLILTNKMLDFVCTRQQENMQEIEASKTQIENKLEDAKEQLQNTMVEVRVQEAEKERLLSIVETVTESLRVTQLKIKSIEDCWKVSTKKVLRMENIIGKGGYGAVYEGRFCHQRVAIKQLYEVIVSDTNIEKIHNEIDTMSRLRHPNLILFIAAVLDDPSGNPLIITELLDMSLRHAYESGRLTNEREKLAIMRDAAAGLNYLHCLPDPIIHRDVSSANILLEAKGTGCWNTKITDFGSAKLARNAKTGNPGAMVYGAPEALLAIIENAKDTVQTTKMDVYSFGVLLCEVMTCKFPDNGKIFDEMKERVSKSSQFIFTLICQCIKQQPEYRPTMITVIELIDSQ